MIKDQKDLEGTVELAKGQIKKYIDGPLYPEDFANCCYLIMVSEKHLDIPDILQEPNYRIINIACKPDRPSDKPAR